jgi:hypothetical protein
MNLTFNRGKGEAVRQGLLAACEAGAKFVGYLDADMATPSVEFVSLVDRLLHDRSLDVALGSRVALLGRRVERPMSRHYAGRIFATVASLALGIGVYDTQCGAKVFRVSPSLTSALGRPFRTKWVFDVELLGRLLHPDDGANSIGSEQFVEIPLMEWHDVAGSHLKVRAAADAFRGLMLVFRQRLRQSGQSSTATSRHTSPQLWVPERD